MDRILKVLIVEDDIDVCNNFQSILENESTLDLIGITNNSKKAVLLISEYLPDAVILDLELHSGGGNGIEVLKEISELFLPITPFFIITTNNTSNITFKMARTLGADFIIQKNEVDYTEKKVIDFLKTMSKVILTSRKSNIQTDETPLEKSKKLTNRIHAQFDLIGISPKAIGYTYLTEAIIMVYTGESHYLCNKIAQNHNKSESSVERAMQNAINKAWNTTEFETLLAYYTSKTHSHKGVPSLTEFIHYYANKLKTAF